MPNSISLTLPLQSSIPLQTFLNNIKTITQSIVSYGTTIQTPSSNLFIGQRYFNTETQSEMIYNGISWVAVVTSGSGISTNLTLNGMVYATGTTSLASTLQPINGQLLIGSTGFPPALSTLTSGSGISVTNGPSTITISNSGILSINGTSNKITATTTSGITTISISSGYIGQSSITTLGTIGTGTWNGALIGGQYGGTGVNNGSSTITIGGNVTFSGLHTFSATLTGNTAITFPTSGTLSTTTGTVTSVTGTSGQIDVATGTTTPVISIDTGYIGQTSITTLGTITTGVWHGTSIANSNLVNSSVTITAGTGMSGGGSVSLGNSITLTNAGVTSNVAGTGVSLSSTTGAVTITNTGVTSLAGTTNQITASTSTGSITLSLPTNLVLPAPSSGTTLLVDMVSGGSAITAVQTGTNNAIVIESPFGTNAGLQLSQLSAVSWQVYIPASTSDLRFSNFSSDIVTIAASGIITFSAYGAGTATFSSAGVISSVSDERLKKDIVPYLNGFDSLKNILPIKYKWTKESGIDPNMDTEYVGFSAQNLQENIPEGVSKNKDGFLSISDRAIIAVLINTIKDQQKRIERLESRILKHH